jgi:hypothetical protein
VLERLVDHDAVAMQLLTRLGLGGYDGFRVIQHRLGVINVGFTVGHLDIRLVDRARVLRAVPRGPFGSDRLLLTIRLDQIPPGLRGGVFDRPLLGWTLRC